MEEGALEGGTGAVGLEGAAGGRVQRHGIRVGALGGSLRRGGVVLRALARGVPEGFDDVDFAAGGPRPLAEHPEGRPRAGTEGDVVDGDDGQEWGLVLFLGRDADRVAHGFLRRRHVDGHVGGPAGGAGSGGGLELGGLG